MWKRGQRYGDAAEPLHGLLIEALHVGCGLFKRNSLDAHDATSGLAVIAELLARSTPPRSVSFPEGIRTAN
jgi:hypothetical protein